MSVRLALARLYVPAALKRRKLGDLARLTAAAFGVEPPALEGPYRARLRAFARFTCETAREALAADTSALEQRLFEQARDFGRELARELGVGDAREAFEAARVLYRCLDIDLRARDGRVIVRRCLFARFYDAAVCRLMSALDSGVFAGLGGLAGNGRLRFERRLTDGATACEARFQWEGAT